jgi:hypothetical protein
LLIIVQIKKIEINCYIESNRYLVSTLASAFATLLFVQEMVSLEFFIDIKSFRSLYGPGVDSASNRNEYQEYFLGVKVAGA